ncbi:YciI family protein [Clostridium oryzae]|uniref:YciI-like protein n=1 Tax=Clostridium oryzae TaxID=1450648 RepID=A0A1V4IIG0_9CLOT|nr:YciI family protein [Clostridium oryzae]OPJ59792.1 YciI-like protein [Clostridium oryzae]
MQFLVIGRDGKDEKALERRLSVREKHLALAGKMAKEGKSLYGGPLLDDTGKMVGSFFVVDFPSREGVDEWLKVEPYVTGNVFKEITIQPCSIAEVFKK